MQSLHQVVFLILWLSMCGYAAVRGGPPERTAACLIVAATVSSALVHTEPSHPFYGIELGIMAVDGCLFVLLVALASVSSRFWPMTMASLQGATLLAHFAKLLDRDTLPASYFVMAVMWSFPILALLGIATWRHDRRQRIYGRDYSWISQLPASYRSGAPCDAAK